MKKEDGIKDLYLDYLRDHSNEQYQVIDEEVQSRNGKNNFDYLLRTDDDRTLALEITQVRKSSLEPNNSNFDLVAKFLRDLLDEGKGMPALAIKIPDFGLTDNKLRGILKRESSRIYDEIRRKSPTIAVGDDFDVPITKSISINVLRASGENNLYISSFPRHNLSSHANELHLIFPDLQKLVLKKNEQLDYDATRRTLLIVDTRYRFPNDKVLQDAVNECIDKNKVQLNNIDEITICSGKDKFATVYLRSED